MTLKELPVILGVFAMWLVEGVFPAVAAQIIAEPQENNVTDLKAAIEIEQQVIDARQRINSGVIEFEVSVTCGPHTKNSAYVISFDGEKIRNDVRQKLSVHRSDGDVGLQHELYHYIFTADEQIFWADFGAGGGRHTAVNLIHMDTERGRIHGDSVDQGYRLDPRRLGVLPRMHSTLHSHGLTHLLTRPDRKSTSLTRLVDSERELVRIEYERQDSRLVTLVVDPARDHSVLEAAIEWPGRFVDRIENTLEQYPDGDEKVWFPRTVHYTRTFPEYGVGIDSLLRVTRAEFNQPIAEKVFTLQSLSLPVGLHASEYPPHEGGNTRFWDGTALRTIRELQVARGQVGPPVVDASDTSRAWLVAANALLLLAIVCGLLWHRGRSRPEPTTEQ